MAIRRGAAVCALAGVATASRPISAAVRINEMTAATSCRLLQTNALGAWQAGPGVPWYAPSFDAGAWPLAVGPFGFGTNYATDLQGLMQNQAISLYLRIPFVAPASLTGAVLVFETRYNDGFVARLNGREALRKSLGAPGSFVFYDQQAFHVHAAASNEMHTLGAAMNRLAPGTNLLTVQVHNKALDSADFAWAGALHLVVGTATQTLIRADDAWRYFVGLQEPSGGLTDGAAPPALPSTGLEWAGLAFDDTGWPRGPGGVGFGDSDDATDVGAEMPGRATALYLRQSFTVTNAAAWGTNALQLAVDFDDGYIAFLNGREIARTNMGLPGEFMSFEAVATAAREAGTAATTRLASASSLLRNGQNVLAFQVHNVDIEDPDLSLIADLSVTGTSPAALVRHQDPWRYFVGIEPPVLETDPDAGLPDADFTDWVELYNDAPTNLPLQGWSLTDDPDDPRRWAFAPHAAIPARGYLVVLCSGRDVRETNAPFLQASFRLDDDGEYLGLYDAGGAEAAAFDPYPAQSYFHSYGWDAAAGAMAFFETPTPGASNTGARMSGRCADPDFLLPGGFHASNVLCRLTGTTSGATIRYTTDGAEPQPDRGAVFPPGGLLLTTATAIRARAFKDGLVPSRTVTRSYLCNQPAALSGLPAVSLAGDPSETFFKSNGVCTIVGGTWWTNGIWASNSVDDVNIPVKRGRAYERPVSAEFVFPAEGKVHRTRAGIRIAGSNYTRPRYRLQNMGGTWYGQAVSNKPQFNLFFRDEYEDAEFSFPFVAGSRVDAFEGIRLRGGHNDYNNPFIRDELARRLLYDTGQASCRGLLAGLYVNGIFRCYYNPCERLDEQFLQQWHRSTNDWDIVNHAGIANGDTVAWNAMIAAARSRDCSALTNYQALCALVDPVNFADYLMVNIYAATWDWPNNNFYAARERSPSGRFRFYIWDAEGAFSNTGNPVPKSNDYDTVGLDLIGKTNVTISVLFDSLRKSPEFRLLFADRFYRHVVDGPALTASNILARTGEMKNQLDPMMQYVRGVTMNISIITNWVPVRPGYMVQHFRLYNLLPGIGRPVFASSGGPVTNGFPVVLSNTNGSGQIYYALDGEDPRAPGGGVAGAPYTRPILIDRSRTIRARVWNGAEWSAAAERSFLSDLPPLVISEIMYHPDGPSPLEFIEVFNAGTQAVNLAGYTFSRGISFDFTSGAVPTLGPGEYAVVVQDLAVFATRYPTNGMKIAGACVGALDNGGETVELSHAQFGVIASVDYKDGWYPQTDGEGLSLTLRSTSEHRSLWAVAEGWRASSRYGGSPGGADAGTVPLPGDVLVNEVLAHTDASPVGDWIELVNVATNPVDLSGWFLSDTEADPHRYRIPTGTVLAAGGLVVFDASNHFGSATAATPFGLSEFGEQVVVSSALDGEGHPTGYRVIRNFHASEREVTLGRYISPDGNTDFVAQQYATPGAANANPRVGPVVVTEILYRGPSNAIQFVELYNLSASNLPLYEPSSGTNTWALEDAVTFAFPTNAVFPAFSPLVVCSTSPAAFRARYGLPTNVPVYGPFTGRLDQGGEDVELWKPLAPDGTNRPRVLVERVEYDDDPPWPSLPSAGYAIERISRLAYGNNPFNWRAGVTNGQPGPPGASDSDGDGVTDAWEARFGLDPLTAGDVQGDSDGDGFTDLEEFVAGTAPDNAQDYFDLLLDTYDEQRYVYFLTRTAHGPGLENLARLYDLQYNVDFRTGTWSAVDAFINYPADDGYCAYPDVDEHGRRANYRVLIRLERNP